MGYIKQSIAGSLKEVILPLLVLLRLHLECCIQFWAPLGDMDILD